MKTFLYTIVTLFLLRACQPGAETVLTREDSMEHYPPTPPALSQQEFRHYYNTCSRFFDSLLINKGFNGSILVAKDGNIVYENYVGFEDFRDKDSLSSSSALHIASASKTFTGMAILKLVEEGKIKLTDSLNTIFPGFPYEGVTVKMLLNHRSGLPNYGYYLSDRKVWSRGVNVINQDVLTTLVKFQPGLTGKPGKRFNYCNTNFVLLALIIEKVSGMNYAEYMKQNYFIPLEMYDTYVYTPSDSARAIPSFNASGRFWENDEFDLTYGDKNIYSTPRDLLKWDQAVHSGKIVNQQLLDSAFTPYSNERPSQHNYGLGWRLMMYPNGKKVVYHTGRWHGFNAFFTRLPDENVTIIVLGNKYNSRIYKTKYIYDLFGAYMHGSDDEEEMAGGYTKSKKSRSKSR